MREGGLHVSHNFTQVSRPCLFHDAFCSRKDFLGYFTPSRAPENRFFFYLSNAKSVNLS